MPPAEIAERVRARHLRDPPFDGRRPTGRTRAPVLRGDDNDAVRRILSVQGRRRGTLEDFDRLDAVRVHLIQRRWRRERSHPGRHARQVLRSVRRLIRVDSHAVDDHDRIVALENTARPAQSEPRWITRRPGRVLHLEARHPRLQEVGDAPNRLGGSDRIGPNGRDVVRDIEPALGDRGCHHDLREARHAHAEREAEDQARVFGKRERALGRRIADRAHPNDVVCGRDLQLVPAGVVRDRRRSRGRPRRDRRARVPLRDRDGRADDRLPGRGVGHISADPARISLDQQHRARRRQHEVDRSATQHLGQRVSDRRVR